MRPTLCADYHLLTRTAAWCSTYRLRRQSNQKHESKNNSISPIVLLTHLPACLPYANAPRPCLHTGTWHAVNNSMEREIFVALLDELTPVARITHWNTKNRIIIAFNIIFIHFKLIVLTLAASILQAFVTSILSVSVYTR